jgi:hypothetical protein
MHTFEGDADSLYRLANADPEDPPGVDVLCRALLNTAPIYADMVALSDLTPWPDGYRLRVNSKAPAHMVAALIGHELAEWWFDRRGASFRSLAAREAACDTLGALLACPRPAFQAALQVLGHRVHELARRFHVSPALSLLRIGELTGRPVRLLGARDRERGEPFAWGDVRSCLAGKERHRVHPIRLADDRRWGLMAR